MLDYVEGLLKIANVFLSVVAGLIAIALFRASQGKEHLKAWKFLIVVLLLFAVQEIFGALRAFQIFSSPYVTHIIPTAMLGFLVAAVLAQIEVHRS